jgi:hypothetical protein
LYGVFNALGGPLKEWDTEVPVNFHPDSEVRVAFLKQNFKKAGISSDAFMDQEGMLIVRLWVNEEERIKPDGKISLSLKIKGILGSTSLVSSKPIGYDHCSEWTISIAPELFDKLELQLTYLGTFENGGNVLCQEHIVLTKTVEDTQVFIPYSHMNAITNIVKILYEFLF